MITTILASNRKFPLTREGFGEPMKEPIRISTSRDPVYCLNKLGKPIEERRKNGPVYTLELDEGTPGNL
jgi:hypothetical protein